MTSRDVTTTPRTAGSCVRSTATVSKTRYREPSAASARSITGSSGVRLPGDDFLERLLRELHVVGVEHREDPAGRVEVGRPAEQPRAGGTGRSPRAVALEHRDDVRRVLDERAELLLGATDLGLCRTQRGEVGRVEVVPDESPVVGPQRCDGDAHDASGARRRLGLAPDLDLGLGRRLGERGAEAGVELAERLSARRRRGATRGDRPARSWRVAPFRRASATPARRARSCRRPRSAAGRRGRLLVRSWVLVPARAPGGCRRRAVPA